MSWFDSRVLCALLGSVLKKAAIAITHRFLVIIYAMLRDATEYRELGGDYFHRLQAERTGQQLTRRLDRLGFDIVVRPGLLPNSFIQHLAFRRTGATGGVKFAIFWRAHRMISEWPVTLPK
jgi:hypothetical protein